MYICVVCTIRLNKYKKRHSLVLAMHVRISDIWQQQQRINNVWSSDEMAYNLTKTTNLTVGVTHRTERIEQKRDTKRER